MHSLENKLKKGNNKDGGDNKNEKQEIYPRYCPICGGYRKGCILYQQELVKLKNKREK